MRHRGICRSIALFIAILVQPACIFANVVTPLAYRSPTPADVGGINHLGAVTSGQACSHVVLGLIAWGDGGFARAMDDAVSHAAPLSSSAAAPTQGAEAPAQVTSPGPVLLADVQADSSALNILGLYARRCTVVHAKVVQ